MPGNILRHATLCFGAVVLAACGGGGGGGDDRGGAQTPALTLEPGSLVAEMDSGVSQPLSVRARPNFTTSSTVYVVVLDKVGVITPNLTLVPQSDVGADAGQRPPHRCTRGARVPGGQLRAGIRRIARDAAL
jgi:hypothetical protein